MQVCEQTPPWIWTWGNNLWMYRSTMAKQTWLSCLPHLEGGVCWWTRTRGSHCSEERIHWVYREEVLPYKYQVPYESLNPLRSWLVSPEFLKSNPIRVYSLACCWNFKEEVDLAAPYTSNFDAMAPTHEEDIQQMKTMELHCILILGNQWYFNSQEYIRTTPPACIGCQNYKTFYATFRYGLLYQLNTDQRAFYDHGRCISCCYEIAKEAERVMGVVACDVEPEFHLRKFIESLAANLSSHLWILFEGSVLPLFGVFCALNLRLDDLGLCWVSVLLSVPVLKSTWC